MRLELESPATAFPLIDIQPDTNSFAPTSWDYESVLKKGVAAAQSGDRDGARKLLSQVTAMNPASEEAWMWLASISDYPEELLAFLNRVLDINPVNVKAKEWRSQTNALMATTFVQRALAARNDGLIDVSRNYLEQAIQHESGCEAAWYWKANMADTDDEKLELLNHVLTLNPDHELAGKAVARIQSDAIEAKLDAARRHADRDEKGEARRLAEGLLDHDSEDIRVEALMVMASVAASDEEQVGYYRSVLEINADEPEAVAAVEAYKRKKIATAFDEARAEAAAGNSEVALEKLNALLQEDPQSVEAWLLVSHLSAAVADKINALEKVREIDPENAAARSGLEYLNSAFGTVQPDSVPMHESVEEPEEPAPVQELSRFRLVENPETHTEELPVEASVIDDDTITPSVEFAYRQTAESVAVEDQPEDDEYQTMASVNGLAAVENPFIEESNEFAYESAAEETWGAEEEDDEVVFLDTEAEAFDNPCSFCSTDNDPQSLVCRGCSSTLTLADLERLLSGTAADRNVVQQAVTEMEAEWNIRDFTETEFVTLAVGHMNLGNFDAGFRYLQEASRVNPNNVILSGHVNTMAIRLDEKRRQSEIYDSMPKGKTILVVDDSPTVRKLISGKLEKSGHHVVCAVDGVDALEKLESGLPDLILLDITMPRMDGYEVCKQIRANPLAKDLPVVMISGKDGFFDKVRGRMAGTTGYVTKPFGPETLMKALETYLLPETVEAN